MPCVLSDDGREYSGLGILVLILASLHTLIRGVEFLVDIISTFVMIESLVSENSLGFKHYLGSETKRVLWKGPYPANFTFASSGATVVGLNLADADADSAAQLRIDLHLWSTHLLMQFIIFVFGWILICSVKKKSYSGTLAWLAFSVPIYLLSLMHLTLDLSFWDFASRPLQSQILQGLDIGFQPIVLILVACLLYQLSRINDEILEIGRYSDGERNGFPRSMGNITTMRAIVDSEERF